MVVGAILHLCADDVIPMTSSSAHYIIMRIGEGLGMHRIAALVGFGVGSVYS